MCGVIKAYNLHTSSIISPVWRNGLMFVYKPSGCGFRFQLKSLNIINHFFCLGWCFLRVSLLDISAYLPLTLIFTSLWLVCMIMKVAWGRENILSKRSLLNCVPCVLKTCSRANVPYVLTCSRANVPCVLTCSRALRAYVLVCKRAILNDDNLYIIQIC